MNDPLFHPSAIHILKLVSGLPKAARERQQILVLQAFIDDSRTKGEVLVLSGFISDALSWAKFSQEWQEMWTVCGCRRSRCLILPLAAAT
ncbi:hypothetical protein AJ88_26085 [Mesorhizobium amorphae CCBAU 01583]|nr:hypothetical protein AJ88_26085 [Mesorhizobium amorphae CCBAU 01583]